VPRFLAAASAAFVRAEIVRRPSSATMAMIPTLNLFGHVGGHEIDARLFQTEEEVSIAA